MIPESLIRAGWRVSDASTERVLVVEHPRYPRAWFSVVYALAVEAHEAQHGRS